MIPLKTNKGELFSYLITLDKEQNFSEQKNLKSMNNLSMSWQPYHRKHNYTQCYTCQAHGHSEYNDNNEP